MADKILIFPAGMPRSLQFLEECKRSGRIVVGASSLNEDASVKHYSTWVFLPFLGEQNFDEALSEVIINHNIDMIFTPNFVVWDYLKTALHSIASEVSLVNDSPIKVELAPYRSAQEFSQLVFKQNLKLLNENAHQYSAIDLLKIASLFRHAETIPGMCDHEKIRALIEISRHCPEGDIVEIGTWWGKSAFVFLELARLNNIGNVLCVDPWRDEDLVQGQKIVDLVSAQCSADEAFEVFKLNLLPYVKNDLNYLRLQSVEGAGEYRQHKIISTAEFGDVKFCGKISILHVDGNHSYLSAKADLEAWAGFVVENGWVVMDDYIWPYGDGPKRAGDEFKLHYTNKISNSFVMGSALFMQLHTAL